MKSQSKSSKNGQQEYVLDLIEEGYVEVDLQGTTVFCNSSFGKIMGFTTQELTGMNYREYMSENTAKSTYIAYNKVFKTGIPCSRFCYEIITKNGNIRTIENSISLVRDSGGHRIGFRSVVRDITDKIKTDKELEMHRSHLKAVFEGVKDAIITLNSDKKEVVEANTAAKIICGFDIKGNVGKKFADCFTQCEKSCQNVINEFLEDEAPNMECQIDCNHKNSNSQRVNIKGSRLLTSNGMIIGSVFVIQDITRITNLEEELKTRHRLSGIIGKSERMQDIYMLISKLADL
ncbi:MAG: PAS domain-containing protein, partial [Candidatus Vecturithrix sp.]|nr:PAS domain-containing protein [Candidatus Vecturithrix sp.]